MPAPLPPQLRPWGTGAPGIGDGNDQGDVSAWVLGYDMQCQANVYESVPAAFGKEAWWAGALFWRWSADPSQGGTRCVCVCTGVFRFVCVCEWYTVFVCVCVHVWCAFCVCVLVSECILSLVCSLYAFSSTWLCLCVDACVYVAAL